MDGLDGEEDDLRTVANLSGDGWSSRFSQWEQECIHSAETNDDIELQIDREKDNCSQKLWHSFQNAACCVAQLYKDRENGVSVWIPFQNAASSVTSLYKDCTESQKRFGELGFQSGVQRRNKELLAWAKKRSRNIRREDLIAFLTGNHHHHHHYPFIHHRGSWGNRQRHAVPAEGGTSSTVASGIRAPPHHALARYTVSDATDVNTEGDGDLQTFREALALSVVGIRNSPQHGSNSGNSRRTTSTKSASSATSGASLAELNAFITEEFTRHVESRKRSSSSTDVIMDSPTHKRSKLL